MDYYWPLGLHLYNGENEVLVDSTIETGESTQMNKVQKCNERSFSNIFFNIIKTASKLRGALWLCFVY